MAMTLGFSVAKDIDESSTMLSDMVIPFQSSGGNGSLAFVVASDLTNTNLKQDSSITITDSSTFDGTYTVVSVNLSTGQVYFASALTADETGNITINSLKVYDFDI